MNLEAKDVGTGLSQPVLGLLAGQCAASRRILLMSVEVWEMLSLLRVGGFYDLGVFSRSCSQQCSLS